MGTGGLGPLYLWSDWCVGGKRVGIAPSFVFFSNSINTTLSSLFHCYATKFQNLSFLNGRSIHSHYSSSSSVWQCQAVCEVPHNILLHKLIRSLMFGQILKLILHDFIFVPLHHNVTILNWFHPCNCKNTISYRHIVHVIKLIVAYHVITTCVSTNNFMLMW